MMEYYKTCAYPKPQTRKKRRSKTDIRIKQVDSARIAENLMQKGMRFSEGLIVK